MMRVVSRCSLKRAHFKMGEMECWWRVSSARKDAAAWGATLEYCHELCVRGCQPHALRLVGWLG